MQLFDLAPTSLWLQDLSALKTCLDGWAREGMTDLRAWLRDPQRLLTCQTLIRIVRINRQTLLTYEGAGRGRIVRAHPRPLPRPARHRARRRPVPALGRRHPGAARQPQPHRDGRVIDVSYAGQMLPGSEAAWDRYLISIEDITAREEQRRREEARLASLSLTDPLTGLLNRAGYEADLDRVRGRGAGAALGDRGRSQRAQSDQRTAWDTRPATP